MSDHILETANGTFDYQLKRSSKRRRTMEIHIRHEGRVEVHAPQSFSMELVESFLRRKDRWILQKLEVFRERQALLEQRRASDVKECFYQGDVHRIRLIISNRPWGRIQFNRSGWVIEIPQGIDAKQHEEYAARFLEKWFKSRALIVLRQRVDHYAALMADRPQTIRIRSPKTLWGSCHPRKQVVHFNWRIIMAPPHVIDYLVVHEMSHLRVADHSSRFWARVEFFCPDYVSSQQWLKRNGYQLRLPFGVLNAFDR